MHSDDLKHTFFLLQVLRLVLKVTYLTLLHKSKDNNHSKIIAPEQRMKIWRIWHSFISILNVLESKFSSLKS